jgi:hypothetical protein
MALLQAQVVVPEGARVQFYIQIFPPFFFFETLVALVTMTSDFIGQFYTDTLLLSLHSKFCWETTSSLLGQSVSFSAHINIQRVSLPQFLLSDPHVKLSNQLPSPCFPNQLLYNTRFFPQSFSYQHQGSTAFFL